MHVVALCLCAAAVQSLSRVWPSVTVWTFVELPESVVWYLFDFCLKNPSPQSWWFLWTVAAPCLWTLCSLFGPWVKHLWGCLTLRPEALATLFYILSCSPGCCILSLPPDLLSSLLIHCSSIEDKAPPLSFNFQYSTFYYFESYLVPFQIHCNTLYSFLSPTSISDLSFKKFKHNTVFIWIC